MFYVEEDILPAVQVANAVFGPPNQYNHDAAFKNVALVTKEFGKIWFGDVQDSVSSTNIIEEIQSKMDKIADTIQQKVYLTMMGDYNTELQIFVSDPSSSN